MIGTGYEKLWFKDVSRPGSGGRGYDRRRSPLERRASGDELFQGGVIEEGTSTHRGRDRARTGLGMKRIPCRGRKRLDEHSPIPSGPLFSYASIIQIGV